VRCKQAISRSSTGDQAIAKKTVADCFTDDDDDDDDGFRAYSLSIRSSNKLEAHVCFVINSRLTS